MSTSKLHKIQYIKAIKNRGNREWSTRRHGCNSRSSFLFRGSTSTLEGCGCHKGLTNATKAHPILRCKLPPQRPSSLSTKGFLKAEPAFTISGHDSTTELEAPKHNTMLWTTTSSNISIHKQGLGTQGTKTQRPLKQMRGEIKSLRWGCRSRPSPSILQRSRALDGWGRRSTSFGELNNGVLLFSWLAACWRRRGGGIYTPPKIWPLPAQEVRL